MLASPFHVIADGIFVFDVYTMLRFRSSSLKQKCGRCVLPNNSLSPNNTLSDHTSTLPSNEEKMQSRRGPRRQFNPKNMLSGPFSEYVEYMKALHVISRDPFCIGMWLERAGLQSSLQDSAKVSLGVISSRAFGAFLRFAPAMLGHYHRMKRLQ